MAEQVSREKENMVHVMSHDLRTPLSIAKMTLEMLQRADNLPPETVRLILDRGLRANDAIERLARGVLDNAKLENGTASSTRTLEVAEDIVRDVVDLTMPLAEKASVQLISQLRAPGAQVLCEKSRIEQVVGNLISNALKFTSEGGSITVSVEQQRIMSSSVLRTPASGSPRNTWSASLSGSGKRITHESKGPALAVDRQSNCGAGGR